MSKIIGITVGTPTSPKSMADKLKPVTMDNLSNAIGTALAQAKESGQFDGKDGETPVRGTDYWTNADKQEIIEDVLSALPTADGGSF